MQKHINISILAALSTALISAAGLASMAGIAGTARADAAQATPAPASHSSSEAFQKFIKSSPIAKKDMTKTMDSESISAACMSSATDRHNGVTLQRDGSIYTWYIAGADDREIRRFVKKDKALTDKVFALKDKGDFAKSVLDYKIDGTSYCYVRMKSGSTSKQITWPKNEIMSGHKQVPPAAKDLFKAAIDTTALALGEKKN